ncbi:6-hydroxymethylpterin diphosphokinase MptE-like protein [Idiomarina xiamenensis]|uniref:Maf protein n=1 Tax=Idiomarina xiamenensis 10-D-4 TaxID=740709 RepID=K2KT77_9GAMM|nr:6-hydroxymethylpterin diphosphokinase MptE-like protein [Idiomarina xiamenensis]EKE80845.1 maf protein [Idiomarina xiamenensis 10-D-4]
MATLEQLLNQAQQALHQAQRSVEREQAFAAEAEPRFERNLAAFHQYFPDIAKAIEQYQSDTPLALHVTESGYANVALTANGAPLYGLEPGKQIAAQVKQQLQQPIISHVDFSGFAKAPADDHRLHSQFTRRLGQIVDEAGRLEPLAQLPTRFPSAVIFGVGLGYHIPLLLEQVQFDYLNIVEPDFNLFYCSLFCIDWAAVIDTVNEQNGCLFLHIGSDYRQFFDDLWQISQDIGAFSLVKTFCYAHYPSEDTQALVTSFTQRMHELHGGYGFYNDATTSLAHTTLNLQHGVNMLVDQQPLSSAYPDYPVVVVGNGPSLDEAAEVLAEIQDQVVIIAAGSALKTLLKMGIKPDFHCLVERPKTTYDILLQTMQPEDYKSISLLTLNVIYPDVIDLYDWVGMAAKPVEAGSELWKIASWLGANQPITYLSSCNPMVSNTALSFALHMGFSQVYLMGVDNGYKDEASQHAKSSFYYEKGLKDKFVQPKARHRLPGNFGGEVMSSDLLAMSCAQMKRLLSLQRFAKVDCYNVGSGARIEGAKPLQPEMILVDTRAPNKQQVVSWIKQHSFTPRQIDDMKPYLQLSQFDQICEHLQALCREPVADAEQALELMRRQSRYLYSHRRSQLSHLHYVLEGVLLYFQCPMMTLLYSFDDPQRCLQAFKRALTLWDDYLQAMREDFPQRWQMKCDWGWQGA